MSIPANRPLRRLNLNLLYALDSILKAPTLTEAGRMMSLSQPAMSMALRQLRTNFGDDLVLYRGGERRLTALGESLQPRIGKVLREAEDAFQLSLDFDPATSRRSIAIAAPEAIELMFLGRVVADILRDGPLLDVRLAAFDYGSVDRMFGRGVDIAIVPETMADPRFESRPLFYNGVVGMVWDEHPTIGASLSLEEYLGGRHAALLEEIERVASFGYDDDPILAQRRIVVRTGLYSMLPSLVIGTDLIVTTTNWLSQYLAALLPVRLVGVPIRQTQTLMVAQWEPHRSGDPMIQWLLKHIVERSRWNHPMQKLDQSV